MSSDWWADFVRQNPVSQESIDHFASIDWTNKYLKDNNYETIPLFSRTLKPNGEDYFFARTINTPQTFPHYICLRKKPYNLENLDQASSQPEPNNPKKTTPPPSKPDCIYLITSGPSGLDGHPNIMHGGLSSAILDEGIGFMVMLHVQSIEGAARQSRAYTVSLKTTYRAPVPTPAEIVVRTWLVKREGRKWTAMGQIIDKDGTVCSEAECLYVLVPAEKL